MPSTTTLSSVPSLTRSLPALTQKEDLKKHPRQGPTGGGEKQVQMKRYKDADSYTTRLKVPPCIFRDVNKDYRPEYSLPQRYAKSILRQTVRDPVQRKTKGMYPNRGSRENKTSREI